jgi:2-iminobutanoate/2-iminopropanoate deaminase
VSGVLALAPDRALVGKGDARAQSRMILSTLRQLLERMGGSLADVAKVTVFLTDMDDRAAVNAERTAAFGEWRPASTLVEVSELAHPEALVEIEGVARLAVLH